MHGAGKKCMAQNKRSWRSTILKQAGGNHLNLFTSVQGVHCFLSIPAVMALVTPRLKADTLTLYLLYGLLSSLFFFLI